LSTTLNKENVSFLSKYSAGLKLECFIIILIFIFAFTQLSLIRAGRAVGRLSGNRHVLKTSLDFVIWNNLSDSVEILLLYFGIEKFMTNISPRMLISDTLKMLHYFVEFTYELNYVTSNRKRAVMLLLIALKKSKSFFVKIVEQISSLIQTSIIPIYRYHGG